MDIEANRKIGNRLRKLRKSSGLKQEEVAKELEKPQSYISKIESGEKSLHVYEAFRYADALKIPHAKLLSEVELVLTGKMTIVAGPSSYEYEFTDLPADDDSPDDPTTNQ